MTIEPRLSLPISVAVALWLVATASPATPLDLSNTPLFTGTTVKPNVMVAIDDSGSMDFETLFPTNSGLLYWSDSARSTWENGNYAQDGFGYAYLFPNGYNNCASQNPSSCAFRDRRIYSNFSAVPPIPSLGYARSAEFNSAYFDPSVTYTPWIGYADSPPANAAYDPTINNSRLDLTTPRQSTADGETFDFRAGMVIPAGVVYYQTITSSSQTTVSNVCFRSANDYYFPNFLELLFRSCRSGYGFASSATINGGTTSQTGFFAGQSDRPTGNENIPVSYYPATFYLRSNTPLPAGFGWKPGAPVIPGKGPNGEALSGYEIKTANFNSSAEYQRAIQNFSNWFTYYRKRHLAVRGGITNAFERISGVRAGSCTINDRNSLTMKDLDVATTRQAFYSEIFATSFSTARGTPNRKALQFLGSQLETNNGIITSPCQQNFAILFTDGYNTDTVESGVGNADQNKGAPYADSYSNTIADVAMRYYDDLGAIANTSIPRNQMRLPAGCSEANRDPALDCKKDLHMVTFGVTLDQQGLIFNNASARSQNDNPYKNPPAWPNPIVNNYGIEQIDDLWHATINGRGQLLNAKTPQKVADAFAAALEKIINTSGSATGVTANSGRLTTDSLIYQASFTGGLWSGDVKAYRTGASNAESDPVWKASTQLNNIQAGNRVVLTTTPTGSATTNNNGFVAKAFRHANLSTAQKSTITEPQLNYVRGDRTQERAKGGQFRNRNNNILGDIVASSAVYVGAPNRFRYPQKWSDARYPNRAMPENSAGTYSDPSSSTAFAQRLANRTPMLYVGANDGMLHGFNAQTGAERLGFVPGSLVPSLAELSNTNYVHRYYVNETPGTGDALIKGSWRSVLVGGLGNGGRSVYALDITNPSDFSESTPASTVLWEYTDKELGKSYGTPSVVRLHNGKWAAMFGNGYNSDKQQASLFLLDIETGAAIARLDTGAGPTPLSEKSANGLSTPFPVDLDGDFITDYAYAGDLYGNVWKFDLTSSNAGDWTVRKLFTATSPNAVPQAISSQVQVGVHPYGRRYGVMVYFGTGKYLENSDAAKNIALQNSFYGVWDLDVFTFNEANNGQPLFVASDKTNVPRARLTTQTVTDQVGNDGNTNRFVSNKSVNYQQSASDGGSRGWVINFPVANGELVIADASLQGDTVAFNTFIPNVQSCTAGGSGFFMQLDRSSGGRTSFLSFDLNGDAQFKTEGDTVVINGERQGASGRSLSQGTMGSAKMAVGDNGNSQAVLSLLGGGTETINVKVDEKSDERISWREIRR